MWSIIYNVSTFVKVLDEYVKNSFYFKNTYNILYYTQNNLCETN